MGAIAIFFSSDYTTHVIDKNTLAPRCVPAQNLIWAKTGSQFMGSTQSVSRPDTARPMTDSMNPRSPREPVQLARMTLLKENGDRRLLLLAAKTARDHLAQMLIEMHHGHGAPYSEHNQFGMRPISRQRA
jgi:hypothetical protein